MYCKKCGNLLNQNETFCSKCGAQIESEEQQFCSHCGEKIKRQTDVSSASPINDETPIQMNESASIAQNPYVVANQPVFQHPMKWFKFLIYFALFFGAVINFVFGFNYIIYVE